MRKRIQRHPLQERSTPVFAGIARLSLGGLLMLGLLDLRGAPARPAQQGEKNVTHGDLRILRVMMLFVAIVLPGRSWAEEPVGWNQERVTVLAAQLHDTFAGLRDEARKAQGGHSWNQYLVLDTLSLLDREAGRLHRELAAGKGRDETSPIMARIASLRHDCALAMRKTHIAKPVLEKLADARSILHEMAPYYGFDPKRDDHTWILGP
jgi:hypothetical protein